MVCAFSSECLIGKEIDCLSILDDDCDSPIDFSSMLFSHGL
jgi:hypothetical protein